MDKVIYLVRHCTAGGQEPNAALTEEGMRQAQALAASLVGQSITRIVASPYNRALQSIAPLAHRLGCTVETDDRLVERVLSSAPLPDWWAQLAASFEDLDLCLPGGESSRAAMARGVAVLSDVLAREETATVVVTHGNLLALMLKHFNPVIGFAQWEQLTNPDVYCMTFTGEGIDTRRVIGH